MHAWLKRWTLLAVVAISLVVLLSSGGRPTPARAATPRFFPETGYSIDDPRFLDFFDKRGGVNTFGYPVSREFTLRGFPGQIFQRAIMQRYPDGHVALMNLLDNGMFPYSKVNGADFPTVDIAMVATAPPPTTPGYSLAILNWVSHNAPDSWNGIPVAFHRTFMNTVSARAAFPTGRPDQSLVGGFDLEIWGVPTSRPTFDPHDRNFVYERFQRGILQYDKATGLTQGILLGDYFKSILMNEHLPADLAAEARNSLYFGQYNPLKPDAVDRPGQLPNTNLTDAFEPAPMVAIDPGHGGNEIGTSHIFADGLILREKNLNLEVANRTTAILRAAGYQVIQTRTTDSWVDAGRKDLTGDGKVNLADELQARIDLANNANATLFLSIHFNGNTDPNIHGTTVYYDDARPFAHRSEYFASLVDREAVAALKRIGFNTLNRGVQTDSRSVGQGNHFYILGPNATRPSRMPGALVEGLFLTNPGDAQMLRNPKTLDTLAQAYARAVELYYSGAH